MFKSIPEAYFIVNKIIYFIFHIVDELVKSSQISKQKPQHVAVTCKLFARLILKTMHFGKKDNVFWFLYVSQITTNISLLRCKYTTKLVVIYFKLFRL